MMVGTASIGIRPDKNTFGEWVEQEIAVLELGVEETDETRVGELSQSLTFKALDLHVQL